MAIPSESNPKTASRQDARRYLAGLDPGEVRTWSERIAAHLAEWIRSRADIGRVALFAALPGEPRLEDLHRLCPDLQWLYPLVGPEDLLTFHLVDDPASLGRGSFGIREPDPGRHPLAGPELIDLVLCPGLGFAPDGSRLGRGRGFYDRLLAGLPRTTPRVGVAFEGQLRERLPTEGHDERMTHLATESGLRPVSPPAAPA